jgi:hypothetical protein
MKLAFSREDETFRSELVAFIEENCPQEAYSTGDFVGTDATGSDGVMVIPEWARRWQRKARAGDSPHSTLSPASGSYALNRPIVS